jgi:hypothetical protein
MGGFKGGNNLKPHENGRKEKGNNPVPIASPE